MKINLKSGLNWSLLDQGMTSGSNFFVNFALAGYLGIEKFGLFSIIWMCAIFINSIQLALITSPMMSLRGAYRENSYYNFYFTLQVLFSLLSTAFLCALLFLYSYYVDNTIGIEVIVAAIFASYSYQIQDFFRRFYFCKENYKLGFASDFFAYLPRVILIPILDYLNVLSIESTLILIGLSSILSVIIVNINSNHKVNLNFVVLKRDIVDSLSYSKWLIYSALLSWVSGNSIFVIISLLLGNYYVGIAKALHNLVGLVNVIFQAMENYLPVYFSKHNQMYGMSQLKLIADRVILVGSGMTLCIGVFLYMFSNIIIPLVYNESYLEYSYLILYFTFTYIFVFVGLINRVYLRALKKTKLIFRAQLISALVMVPLSLYSTSSFGLSGSLVSLNVSLFVFFIFSYYRFWKIS